MAPPAGTRTGPARPAAPPAAHPTAPADFGRPAAGRSPVGPSPGGSSWPEATVAAPPAIRPRHSPHPGLRRGWTTPLERALEAVTFRAGGKAHLGGRLALIYRSVDYYREGPAER